jgi:hypothetical protein
VADPDATDDLGSIFDEAPETSAPDAEPEAAPDTRLGALVGEFLSLDRRRVHGDPPLDPAESRRLAEVQELLEYEFGASAPPLGGTRRSSLRVPTELKVNTAGGATGASLCSLSRGGGFIETEDALDPGTSLELGIDPGNGGAPLRLTATVRWRRELPNMDGPAGVGVEFADLEDDDFIALEKLVARALHARARESA